MKYYRIDTSTQPIQSLHTEITNYISVDGNTVYNIYKVNDNTGGCMVLPNNEYSVMKAGKNLVLVSRTNINPFINPLLLEEIPEKQFLALFNL
jgi:hypothetical protein